MRFPISHLTGFLAVIALIAAGCSTVARHDVMIDAISAGPSAFGGPSYRLVAKDPVLAKNSVEYPIAARAVTAMLNARGLHESPETGRTDLIVELDYGDVTTAIPGNRPTYELFLKLSARKYDPAAASRNFRGEEVWDVRASVVSPQADLESVLPVLAVAAVEYAGTSVQPLKPIEIRDDVPAVIAARRRN